MWYNWSAAFCPEGNNYTRFSLRPRDFPLNLYSFLGGQQICKDKQRPILSSLSILSKQCIRGGFTSSYRWGKAPPGRFTQRRFRQLLQRNRSGGTKQSCRGDEKDRKSADVQTMIEYSRDANTTHAWNSWRRVNQVKRKRKGGILSERKTYCVWVCWHV